MTFEIIKELENSGLNTTEINSINDTASLTLSFYYGSSGRPLLYTYDIINDIKVVRIGDEWEAVGTMKVSSNNRNTSPFSLDLNIRENMLVICGWNLSANNSNIKIVNSSPTGELLVRFLGNVNHPTTPNTYITKNSFVYIKDE